MQIKLLKRFIFILSVGISFQCQAQAPNLKAYSFWENWNTSFATGASMIATEYYKDLSVFVNDMTHTPGLTYSLSFTKLITRNWELGYEFETSNFNGYNDNPFPDRSKSKLLAMYHHEIISKMEQAPIYYHTTTISHFGRLVYHFPNFGSLKFGVSRFNLYMLARVGRTTVNSVLRYKENDEIVYAKTSLINSNNENITPSIDALSYSLGLGVRVYINERIMCYMEGVATCVVNDCLDAMQNLKEYPIDMNYVNGSYAKIVTGISYSLNWKLINKRSNFYKSNYRSSKYAPDPNKLKRLKQMVWYDRTKGKDHKK